jgi:hypothetical protein
MGDTQVISGFSRGSILVFLVKSLSKHSGRNTTTLIELICQFSIFDLWHQRHKQISIFGTGEIPIYPSDLHKMKDAPSRQKTLKIGEDL